MKDHIVIGFLAQTPCLAKFWFLRYVPKSSRPIRLQDFKTTLSQGQNDLVCAAKAASLCRTVKEKEETRKELVTALKKLKSTKSCNYQKLI